MANDDSCLFKVSLKLGLSEWSDKFSVDTVGSIGTVQCKLKDHQIVPVSQDGFNPMFAID